MAATPQSIVKNWQAAMQSGQTAQKYRDAINNVQQSPMDAAVAAVQSGKYLAGIQRSLASGKMLKKLQGASFAAWKANASGPGATNLTTGAQKGLPKMQAAAAQIAAAGQAAAAAAAQANSPMEKVRASIAATQSAWGYTPTV